MTINEAIYDLIMKGFPEHADAVSWVLGERDKLLEERTSWAAAAGDVAKEKNQQKKRADDATARAEDAEKELAELKASMLGKWASRLKARAESAEKELAELKAILADPAAVNVNILRGTIARPREYDYAAELQVKLEAAEKAAAEMREGLLAIKEELYCGCTKGSFRYNCNKCRLKKKIIEPALSSDAGKGYIKADVLGGLYQEAIALNDGHDWPISRIIMSKIKQLESQ